MRKLIGLMGEIWDDLLDSALGKTLLIFLILAAAAILASGCSAAQAIAKGTAQVQRHATDIRTEVGGARHDLAGNNPAGVGKHLDAIDGHAASIQTIAAEVQAQIPGVQDRVPYWLTVVKWSVGTLALIVVVVIAWRLNLLLALEAGLQVVATWVHGIFGRIIGA